MNTNQKVLSIMTGYEIVATIEALEKQGVNASCFKLLRQDRKLAREVADIILAKSLGDNEIDKILSSIVSPENYFGPSDWLRYFEIRVDPGLPALESRLQKILNEDCPFEKGKKVKDTHFLFCLPKKIETLTMNRYLTIQTWRKILSSNGQPRFVGGNATTRWFDLQDHARSPRHRYDWFLMYKEVVHHYRDSPEIQKIPHYYLKPTVLEAVSMHFLYYIKYKIYLNKDQAGCTCDENFEETPPNFVSVGLFDKIGLSISGSTDSSGIFLFRSL